MVTGCSDTSTAAGEDLVGSAPSAVAWVCLEQNGPWGAKAWTQSRLDTTLGAQIEAAAEVAGVRPCLVRRPGRPEHAEDAPGREVLIAFTAPGRSWLLVGSVADPAALLDLSWSAVAAGDLEAVAASLPGLRPSAEPVLLVCTNGTRDTCCARLGRPVAAQAQQAYPGRVWETTHISGHRFAATTLLLPSGVLHGRVLDATSILAAADRGVLATTGYRGRATWSPGAQVAEAHVRSTEPDALGIEDLTVEPDVDAWTVRHRDGRSWWVAVSAGSGPERPESCGKDPKPLTRYTARTVTARPAASP